MQNKLWISSATSHAKVLSDKLPSANNLFLDRYTDYSLQFSRKHLRELTQKSFLQNRNCRLNEGTDRWDLSLEQFPCSIGMRGLAARAMFSEYFTTRDKQGNKFRALVLLILLSSWEFVCQVAGFRSLREVLIGRKWVVRSQDKNSRRNYFQQQVSWTFLRLCPNL